MNKLVYLVFLFAATAAAAGELAGPVGGGGGGGGSGTVTSIATACGVSGGPITTTGTITGQVVPDSQTGSNYPFVTGDCGKLVNLSNASNQIPTIPQAGSVGFPSGWYVNVCNQGAGTQTITPTTSTIGGGATYALAAGSAAAPTCVGIVSDGTNYQVAPAGSSAVANLGPHPGYNTTNWYLPQGHATMGGGGAATANRIMCSLGYIPNKITIGSLGIRINTIGSSNVQLALYTNVSGVPGALLSSTGNIANTATGFFSASLGASQQVGPGSASGAFIWFCFNSNDSTVALTGYQGSTGSAVESSVIGASTGVNAIGNGTNAIVGKQCTGASCQGGSSTFGTWPPNLNTSTFSDVTSAIAVSIAFQASSVP